MKPIILIAYLIISAVCHAQTSDFENQVDKLFADYNFKDVPGLSVRVL